MKLLYKFDGNLPFFCFFFFLYPMQHERCCWWSRLWKKLQMENWTVQTSMPGIVFFQTTELCHPSIPTQSPVLCACLRWWNWYKFLWSNHLAKKVVSGSPGLLEFAIRPVKSVLNLPSKCPASELLLLLLLLLLCCFFWGGGGGDSNDRRAVFNDVDQKV